MAGVDTVFAEEAGNLYSGEGKHLPLTLQTLGGELLQGLRNLPVAAETLLKTPNGKAEAQRSGNPPRAKATLKTSTLAWGWAPSKGRLPGQLKGDG